MSKKTPDNKVEIFEIPCRSLCPISKALDVVGDKWTLLLIRDLLFSSKKFKDFENSPEHIPTNILASRLKKLEQFGFIKRTLYQEKPKRYEYSLLQKGRDLIPVLQGIAEWANKYCDGAGRPPEKFWDLTTKT